MPKHTFTKRNFIFSCCLSLLHFSSSIFLSLCARTHSILSTTTKRSMEFHTNSATTDSNAIVCCFFSSCICICIYLVCWCICADISFILLFWWPAISNKSLFYIKFWKQEKIPTSKRPNTRIQTHQCPSGKLNDFLHCPDSCVLLLFPSFYLIFFSFNFLLILYFNAIML